MVHRGRGGATANGSLKSDQVTRRARALTLKVYVVVGLRNTILFAFLQPAHTTVAVHVDVEARGWIAAP
jgi:hypothetical protein